MENLQIGSLLSKSMFTILAAKTSFFRGGQKQQKINFSSLLNSISMP